MTGWGSVPDVAVRTTRARHCTSAALAARPINGMAMRISIGVSTSSGRTAWNKMPDRLMFSVVLVTHKDSPMQR